MTYLCFYAFFNRKRQRQKRSPKVAARPKPGGNIGSAGEVNSLFISVPRCVDEGIILIQGEDNYFLKCKKNPTTGGFFQIIYVCPSEMRSVSDTTKCIPPPDCAECGTAGTGTAGNAAADPYSYNGLVN